MSVYVGIDVHRKRSQVAVIDAKGEVLANRNVPNGADAARAVLITICRPGPSLWHPPALPV